jgi:hypothetical protein
MLELWQLPGLLRPPPLQLLPKSMVCKLRDPGISRADWLTVHSLMADDFLVAWHACPTTDILFWGTDNDPRNAPPLPVSVGTGWANSSGSGAGTWGAGTWEGSAAAAAGVMRRPLGFVKSPTHVDTVQWALFSSLLELLASGINSGRGCADG